MSNHQVTLPDSKGSLHSYTLTGTPT
ncbi:dihydrodipicolinate synthase family protein, partial [Brucella anthropi]